MKMCDFYHFLLIAYLKK